MHTPNLLRLFNRGSKSKEALATRVIPTITNTAEASRRQAAEDDVVAGNKSTEVAPAILKAPTAGQGAVLQRRAGMTPFVYREPNPAAALNTDEGLASFMGQSTSTADWNKRLKRVHHANGGNYPANWYQVVVLSGLYKQKESEFQGK